MTQYEMEKRLKTLEDIDAIRNMHNDYIYALASQQWDDMLDCFAKDSIADIWTHGARVGKKQSVNFFTDLTARYCQRTDTWQPSQL